MPNTVKYSASTETFALKKGDWWIGTGDVGKGPTVTTNYWMGISPPSGGYAIYLPGGQGPNITTPANDSDLIVQTNRLSGLTFVTGPSALNWYNSQSDKMVMNIDYPYLNTNGLIMNLDAGFTPSYPKGGTSWYDVGPSGNTATLINGPTYSSADGGCIVFDGTDDYVNLNLGQNISDQSFTLSFFFKNLSASDWTDFVTLLNPSNTGLFVFEKGGNNGFPLTNGYLKVYPFGVSSLVDVYLPGLFVNDSNIHSFTITSSSTSWNLYGDGLLYGTGPISGPAQSFNRVNIATDISRSNRFCKNQNYLTQIYNRSLSSTEVLQNYYAILNTRILITSGMALNLQAGNPFSYPGSGTTWYDVSGNSNSGTLLNGTSYSVVGGGSFLFDGTDDYVNIGVNKSCNRFTGDFAVSAWVNRSNAGGTWGNIIGDYYTNSTGNPLEWQLAISNSAQLFVYNVTGGFIIGYTPSGFSPNTWINVVLSRIGSNLRLYANNNLIASVTNTTTFGSATGNLNIGIDGNNSSEPFTGRIASVMIQKDRGLSASEVQQNYNAQKSTYGL